MGYVGEGSDKDGRNCAGAGGALKCNCSGVASIWKQYMGGYGGYVKSTRGIPSSGIQKDFGVYTSVYYGWIVVMSPGDRRARDHRALANKGIHPVDAGLHCNVVGLSAYI